jgi:hypothetical protein
MAVGCGRERKGGMLALIEMTGCVELGGNSQESEENCQLNKTR